MSDSSRYPRQLTSREIEWLDYLLPDERPGYAALRRQIDGLLVLGEGRWGEGDLMLGDPAAEIDLEAPMLPVVAFAELSVRIPDGTEQTIVLSVHQPDEEGLIEFQRTTLSGLPLPDQFEERGRWTYSTWMPGDPCPATGRVVREVQLSESGDLLLALATGKQVLWVFDQRSMMNTLVPVTNFYNELMLLKGERDPGRALNHKLLFDAMETFTDAELRDAFTRYNKVFRKVDQERLILPASGEEEGMQRQSMMKRFRNMFGGRG